MLLVDPDVKHLVPRPDVERYKRPSTPSAVRRLDQVEHERTMQALDFEMSTVVSVQWMVTE